MAPTSPLNIIVGTLDVGTPGPYEQTLQRVIRHLRGLGHHVTVVAVRADEAAATVLRRPPTRALERRAPGFVAHATLLNAFTRLDVTSADLVISTHPPSQAMRHARHLALFFGYDRPFYDLANLMVTSGLAQDDQLHMELSTLVRQADKTGLDEVTRFLVPSMEVQKHLRDFNRIERVTDFHPGGAPVAGANHTPPDDETTCIVCMSPHTFPARTELFVQAAHLLPEVAAVSVGEGERLEWVRRVDRGLDRVTAIPSERLWRRPPDGALPVPTVHGSPVVTFIPWARRDQLHALRRAASCVVAPGLGEAFGYAVLDAMSNGTPAVVCKDGGSLRELVESTGSGLVVDPEPRAMADAVRRLIHDRRLAEQCRQNALEAVEHRFTWEGAFAQLEFAIDAVVQT